MPVDTRQDGAVLGWSLIFVTFLLVVFGALLYVNGDAGWAQLLWVFASGTAGAGVMAIVDKR